MNAVASGFEILDELVGANDDDDVRAGDKRNNTSSRAISNDNLTVLGDTIDGGDDVGRGGSSDGQQRHELSRVTSALGQGLAMQVAPLTTILALKDLDEADLGLENASGSEKCAVGVSIQCAHRLVDLTEKLTYQGD